MNKKEAYCAIALTVVLSLLLVGCEDKKGLNPAPTAGGVLEVYDVSDTLRRTATGTGVRVISRRPAVNGTYTDIEWIAIPHTYIRMDGLSGNGGSAFYLTAKAAYTFNYVYFFFQWADNRENKYWRPVVYEGPDWTAADNCTTRADSLTNPVFWARSDDDEDRFALLFDMGSAVGEYGTFWGTGCASFCHGAQAGLKTISGSLDLWQWEASRSNAEYVDIFSGDNRTQTGFCEDGFVDATGVHLDSGDSLYTPNFDRTLTPTSDPALGYVPYRISGGTNGGFAKSRYVFKDSSKPLRKCDIKNPANEDNLWKKGDPFPSFLMRKKFTGDSDPQNPAYNNSNVDIMAKGVWVSPSLGRGRWTLEIVRKLDTLHPQEDVVFDIDNTKDYVFSIAIMDNSGRIHSGSQPLTLHFRPREAKNHQ
ncbi:MAG: ethylbenzene dehydrogenase-related protein [Candidatus Eisenbacteria bacterium]|nr:ethylbenzene dehydrogenase-related protein [Candidatus Eisenbacteria bacterium]